MAWRATPERSRLARTFSATRSVGVFTSGPPSRAGVGAECSEAFLSGSSVRRLLAAFLVAAFLVAAFLVASFSVAAFLAVFFLAVFFVDACFFEAGFFEAWLAALFPVVS